jgi:serine/threonine protein kinase
MHDIGHHLGQCLQVGDVFFQRYRIQEIREGGMGTVYVARDPAVNLADPQSKYRQEAGRGTCHTWAVKTFQDRYLANRAIVEHFVREAIAWMELPRHDNVVFAHYVSLISGRPYLFLEYVDGPNLRHWMEDSEHDVSQATALALQICDGMAHIHQVGGLLHRDIKPENLLVCDKVLKLTDLGLVCALDSLSEQTLGYYSGDRRYMAPEQFKGEVSARSDIYSFGVVLYELLTGQRPSFSGGSSIPARPHEITTAVPPELSEIVMKCLARNPQERYESFAGVKEDIATVVAHHFSALQSTNDKKPSNVWEVEIFLERERRAHSKEEPDQHSRYLIAHSLASLGQHQEALQYLEPLARPVDGYSEGGRALILFGNCLNALGDYRRALHAFQQSLTTVIWSDSARSSYVNLDKVACSHDTEIVDSMIDPMSGCMKCEPGSVLLHTTFVFPCGGPEKPFAHLHHLHQLQRGDQLPFVWVAMAYSCIRLGNPAEAAECLRRAAALDQLIPRYWPTMWSPLVDSPEYEGSIATKLNAQPELRILWYEVKGNILLALRRGDEAVQSYATALSVDPYYAPTWRKFVQALSQHRGSTFAAQDIAAAAETAMEGNLSKSVAHRRLSVLLSKLRLTGLLYGRWSDTWNNIGYFLKQQGQHTEALYCYREATTYNSKNWMAWANLGSLLGMLGNYREALECSDKSLAINPRNRAASLNREHALRLLGRHQ